MFEIIGGILVLSIMILLSGIKVVKENSRLVVFRAGKLNGSKGPGVHLILPIIEHTELVDMRLMAQTTPVIECVSRDNFAVRLSAVCLYQVGDPLKLVGRVENLQEAMAAVVQKVLRSQVAEIDLEDLRGDGRKVSRRLKVELEKQTRAWGLKINSIDLADLQAFSAVAPQSWSAQQHAVGLEQVEI